MNGDTNDHELRRGSHGTFRQRRTPQKVMTSTSAEERAGHLRDHGLKIPTHEEINSRHSDLADVTGAGSGATTVAAVGAAVGVAAAIA